MVHLVEIRKEEKLIYFKEQNVELFSEENNTYFT